MKLQHIVLMGILPFIFGSCEKPEFDKFVYESYNGSLAPEYRERYIVEILADKITYTTFSPNKKNFKLDVIQKEESKLNSTDLKKIKKQIYELGVIKCNSSDDCDGGGTQTVTGYKNGKTVFSNTHYGCSKDCDGFYELLKFLNAYRRKH